MAGVPLHQLLERQLRKVGLEAETPPADPEQWRALLKKVHDAYEEADQERYTLERSLMLSSDEMRALYEDLRQRSVSELTRSHGELEASLAISRATLEASPDGIVVVDQDQHIVEYNHRFVEMWDIPEELIATRDARLVVEQMSHHLVDPEALVARVRESGAREVVVHDELRFEDGRIVDRHSVPIGQGGGGRVVSFRDVTVRRRAEDTVRHALTLSERRFAELAEAGIIGVITVAHSTRITSANDAFLRMLGYTSEDFDAGLVQPESLQVPGLDGWAEAHAEVLTSGVLRPTERRYRRKDGTVATTLVGATCVEHGELIAFIIDISEQMRAQEALSLAEQQLRQAQKMEAVGRLAGGIAHDFNNLLSVILSYSAFVLEDLHRSDPVRADVEEVCKAARRAADLVKQILLFSRQQVVEACVVDLNEVLQGMDRMLRRTLGEDIELVSLPAAAPLLVWVDRGHLDQAILNLVVNARDAMPAGGRLTIQAGHTTLGDHDVADLGLPRAGRYVSLAVSDTGVGMDAATLGRVFEPFFTTKEPGKGTGLGLATVFGIVQQSGGSVIVDSAPGRGTTFTLHLPETGAQGSTGPSRPPSGPGRGSELVLLVEDEGAVRQAARAILLRQGYRVIEARGGAEALALFDTHEASIDVLVTDLVMPGMSGSELARRLVQRRPDLPVLCMSGFTDGRLGRQTADDVAFLQKPFTPASLTAKLREVLDTRPGR